MSLSDIYEMLDSIPEFKDKVAYHHFPVGEAPELPYIVYLTRGTDNFSADNKVYAEIEDIDIELYTKYKDPATEGLIKSALNEKGLFWNLEEDFLDSEQMYMVTFTIQI